MFSLVYKPCNFFFICLFQTIIWRKIWEPWLVKQAYTLSIRYFPVVNFTDVNLYSNSWGKSHLCEVSGEKYIWWFDKCHTNLSQSSDKQGGTHGQTKLCCVVCVLLCLLCFTQMCRFILLSSWIMTLCDVIIKSFFPVFCVLYCFCILHLIKIAYQSINQSIKLYYSQRPIENIQTDKE